MPLGGLALFERYPHLWGTFFSVALLSVLLTGGFYWFAQQAKLLPAIRSRDIHTVRKPRVGGVAMWLAVVISLVFLATGPGHALTDFGGNQLLAILAGLFVILVTGLIDDLYDLPWWGQISGQLLAAACLVVGGVGVPYIRVPLVGQVLLNSVVSGTFTVLWTVTMINVLNFFDGLDGLAGSISLTACGILLIVALQFGYLSTATLTIVLAGAVAGFLPWNWHPSKLFMGTVGSQMLGFLLAVIAIVSGGKLATAVLVLGIPVFDALIVVLRRLNAHQSPFHADLRHLHHRLLKIGLPVPAVVLLVNSIAILFGVFALTFQQTNTKGLLTLLLMLLIVVGIIITYALERRAIKQLQ